MEITRENFTTELPVVLQAIEDADFLSFDCEFTGIGAGASLILPFDTPVLVYAKARNNLNDYTVVQFGLATFKYDALQKRFLHRVFNFYVFPRMPNDLSGLLRKISAPYQSFSCQAESLEFLAQQNFDFNKWIFKGVGFLKKSVVDEMKEQLSQKFCSWSKKDPAANKKINIPDAHKAKLDALAKRVDEFYKSAEEQLIMDDIQTFEKRLLVNMVEKKYGPSTLYVDGERNLNKTLRVTVIKCKNEDEYKQVTKCHQGKKLALLDDAAGFCNIITAISESKKPLIGHNVYLDLLHMLKAFCCDLPQDYPDFKHLVKKLFPTIIDTKVLSSQKSVKKHFGFANSLIQIYERLELAPFRRIKSDPEDERYSYEHSSDNLHEAGYDAYLTGLIFISLADFIAIANNKNRLAADTFDICWDLMTLFYRKVGSGRIVDMPHLDLSLTPESNMLPDRSHVFYFIMPSEWTKDQIENLFSPYGAIQIAWINETSCFVSLKERKYSKLMFQNMVSKIADNDQQPWCVKPCVEYFKQQENLVASNVLILQ